MIQHFNGVIKKVLPNGFWTQIATFITGLGMQVFLVNVKEL